MLPVGENVEWDINLHKQCLLNIFINIIFTLKVLNALFHRIEVYQSTLTEQEQEDVFISL